MECRKPLLCGKSMQFSIAFLLAACHFFGLVLAQKRGFGGYDVSTRQYPFVVAILRTGTIRGAGAILAPRWILSTWNTFEEFPLQGYVAHVGGDAVGDGEKFESLMIYQHSEYLGYTDNIALMKLYRKIKFGPTAQPIKLIDADFDGISNVLMLSYGKNEAGSWHLRATGYSLSSGDSCKASLPNNLAFQAIDWKQGYCQFALDGNKGQWMDDTGAPIIYNDRLAAIHAVRVENYTGNYNKVSLAMRVYTYRSWIENTMKL